MLCLQVVVAIFTSIKIMPKKINFSYGSFWHCFLLVIIRLVYNYYRAGRIVELVTLHTILVYCRTIPMIRVISV